MIGSSSRYLTRRQSRRPATTPRPTSREIAGRALHEGRQLADRVHGAAVFADISGFTTVTEVLATELGPQRGAEELTANLDRVFHALIGALDRYGGEVIYFSGDAITCWLDSDDGTRAAACGLAMQDVMERVGVVVSPGGTVVRLAIKVAAVVGRARRFVVGDPDIQLMDVLAGSIVDELAAAEQLAGPNEVVLGASALRALGDRAQIGDRRTEAGGGDAVGVLARLLVEAPEIVPAEPDGALPEELVRPWLLPAVYQRLRAGRGEFLAELRPAIPVFIRFTGIDYDGDDAAADTLNDFVGRAQRVLARCGGNLLQIVLGDKGAYLYAIFGSPHAHEDDTARAVAAALELRDLADATSVADIQIGLTTGRVWSGTYGHAMRRTFTCLGDAVNLSARLMSKAPPGGVYATEAVRDQAGDAFSWESIPAMRVKGKAEPVAACSLLGARNRGMRRRRYPLELVGRRKELQVLHAALDDSLERGWTRRRHRRRGGHGQVAPRRRVRAGRPRRRSPRRLRRVRGLRSQSQLLGLARDLVHPAGARRRAVRGGADRCRRPAVGRHRSGARGPRAVARCGARRHHPRHGPDAAARSEAAQGVVGGPPGSVAAGSRRRRTARPRPGGLPLDRSAVARPPRGPRAGKRWAPGAVGPQLPPELRSPAATSGSPDCRSSRRSS